MTAQKDKLKNIVGIFENFQQSCYVFNQPKTVHLEYEDSWVNDQYIEVRTVDGYESHAEEPLLVIVLHARIDEVENYRDEIEEILKTAKNPEECFFNLVEWVEKKFGDFTCNPDQEREIVTVPVTKLRWREWQHNGGGFVMEWVDENGNTYVDTRPEVQTVRFVDGPKKSCWYFKYGWDGRTVPEEPENDYDANWTYEGDVYLHFKTFKDLFIWLYHNEDVYNMENMVIGCIVSHVMEHPVLVMEGN